MMDIYAINEILLRLVVALLRERELDDEWNEYLPYRDSLLELADHGTIDLDTRKRLTSLADWCRPRGEDGW
jgi:hypothetical protein